MMADKTTLGIACIVVLFLLSAGWWFWSPTPLEQRDRTDWSAADAFQYYVDCQLEGDIDTIASMVLPSHRESFTDAAAGLDEDALIAAGLNFKQEEYALAEELEDRATFLSQRSGLYFVLTRERGEWFVDAARTDFMNGEGPDPGPSPPTP